VQASTAPAAGSRIVATTFQPRAANSCVLASIDVLREHDAAHAFPTTR